MIANHREPHLHLIGLLAAQQRWAGVLEIVALLDSQALLDSRTFQPTEDIPGLDALDGIALLLVAQSGKVSPRSRSALLRSVG